MFEKNEKVNDPYSKVKKGFFYDSLEPNKFKKAKYKYYQQKERGSNKNSLATTENPNSQPEKTVFRFINGSSGDGPYSEKYGKKFFDSLKFWEQEKAAQKQRALEKKRMTLPKKETNFKTALHNLIAVIDQENKYDPEVSSLCCTITGILQGLTDEALKEHNNSFKSAKSFSLMMQDFKKENEKFFEFPEVRAKSPVQPQAKKVVNLNIAKYGNNITLVIYLLAKKQNSKDNIKKFEKQIEDLQQALKIKKLKKLPEIKEIKNYEQYNEIVDTYNTRIKKLEEFLIKNSLLVINKSAPKLKN